jgi:hypothetical protein
MNPDSNQENVLTAAEQIARIGLTIIDQYSDEDVRELGHDVDRWGSVIRQHLTSIQPNLSIPEILAELQKTVDKMKAHKLLDETIMLESNINKIKNLLGIKAINT